MGGQGLGLGVWPVVHVRVHARTQSSELFTVCILNSCCLLLIFAPTWNSDGTVPRRTRFTPLEKKDSAHKPLEFSAYLSVHVCVGDAGNDVVDYEQALLGE